MEYLGYFHFVCLPCRKTVKRQLIVPAKCAHCGRLMLNLGKLFSAPPRRDDKGWKKIEWMVERGWNGYNFPSSPKMSLRVVQESLTVTQEKRAAFQREQKINASLQEVKRRARRNFRKSKIARKRQNADLAAQEKYQAKVMAEIEARRDKI